MIAESKLLLQGVFSGAANVRFPTDERPTKQLRRGVDTLQASSSNANGKTVPAPPPPPAAEGHQRNNTSSNVTVAEVKEQIVSDLTQFAPGRTPPAIQKKIDDIFTKSTNHRKAMQNILQYHCRNCILTGIILPNHQLRQCRHLGNPCVMPCHKCVAAGRATNNVHWVEMCPFK